MSYDFANSYRNYHPIAYRSEPYSPVPGWGMRPLLAGPRYLGVGGLGMDVVIDLPIVGKQTIKMPIEGAIESGVEAAWPKIEAKLKLSLDQALDDGKKAMHQDVVVAAVVIVAAIVGSAYWVKKMR